MTPELAERVNHLRLLSKRSNVFDYSITAKTINWDVQCTQRFIFAKYHNDPFLKSIKLNKPNLDTKEEICDEFEYYLESEYPKPFIFTLKQNILLQTSGSSIGSKDLYFRYKLHKLFKTYCKDKVFDVFRLTYHYDYDIITNVTTISYDISLYD